MERTFAIVKNGMGTAWMGRNGSVKIGFDFGMGIGFGFGFDFGMGIDSGIQTDLVMMTARSIVMAVTKAAVKFDFDFVQTDFVGMGTAGSVGSVGSVGIVGSERIGLVVLRTLARVIVIAQTVVRMMMWAVCVAVCL